MKKLPFLLLVFFVLISISQAEAQSDTSSTVTYDVIYLTKGGALKGEILSFDERTGGISFRDQNGVKYFFAQEEYKYYKENQVFQKKNKNKRIYTRKENEFEITVGLSASPYLISNDFTADENYVNAVDGLAVIPISIKLGFGKYLNRQNYIGLTGEYGGNGYLNVGLRYAHQYQSYKKNTAFYLPLEMNYNRTQFEANYDLNDTLFTQGGWEYPVRQDIKTTLNAINLSIGQGVSFILQNKKSISIELLFMKNIILSQNFEDVAVDPDSHFNAAGIKLALLYNF